MSSLKAAAAKAKAGAGPAAKRAARAPVRSAPKSGADISGEAKRLAAEIERHAAKGQFASVRPT
jgi:hypothetical protein